MTQEAHEETQQPQPQDQPATPSPKLDAALRRLVKSLEESVSEKDPSLRSDTASISYLRYCHREAVCYARWVRQAPPSLGLNLTHFCTGLSTLVRPLPHDKDERKLHRAVYAEFLRRLHPLADPEMDGDPLRTLALWALFQQQAVVDLAPLGDSRDPKADHKRRVEALSRRELVVADLCEMALVIGEISARSYAATE